MNGNKWFYLAVGFFLLWWIKKQQRMASDSLKIDKLGSKVIEGKSVDDELNTFDFLFRQKNAEDSFSALKDQAKDAQWFIGPCLDEERCTAQYRTNSGTYSTGIIAPRWFLTSWLNVR